MRNALLLCALVLLPSAASARAVHPVLRLAGRQPRFGAGIVRQLEALSSARTRGGSPAAAALATSQLELAAAARLVQDAAAIEESDLVKAFGAEGGAKAAAVLRDLEAGADIRALAMNTNAKETAKLAGLLDRLYDAREGGAEGGDGLTAGSEGSGAPALSAHAGSVMREFVTSAVLTDPLYGRVHVEKGTYRGRQAFRYTSPDGSRTDVAVILPPVRDWASARAAALALGPGWDLPTMSAMTALKGAGLGGEGSMVAWARNDDGELDATTLAGKSMAANVDDSGVSFYDLSDEGLAAVRSLMSSLEERLTNGEFESEEERSAAATRFQSLQAHLARFGEGLNVQAWTTVVMRRPKVPLN